MNTLIFPAVASNPISFVGLVYSRENVCYFFEEIKFFLCLIGYLVKMFQLLNVSSLVSR